VLPARVHSSLSVTAAERRNGSTRPAEGPHWPPGYHSLRDPTPTDVTPPRHRRRECDCPASPPVRSRSGASREPQLAGRRDQSTAFRPRTARGLAPQLRHHGATMVTRVLGHRGPIRRRADVASIGGAV